MAKNYDIKVYNECKRLYVQEGKSPAQVARAMSGKPSKQTITLWASKKDKDGKTWRDYKLDERDRQFEAVSPANIATKILDRIYDVLNSPDWTEKSPDALVKLSKMMERILEPKYQIPVMYHMLTEMVTYFRRHNKKMVTKEFLAAVQEFKNHLRGQLTGDV